MKKILDPDPYFRLWWLLTTVREGIWRARRRELQPAGIYVRESSLLFCLSVLGKSATPSQISSLTFRPPHSVSMLLTRMEKKGLIRKVKDLHKKNLIRVEVTEKGQKAYEYAAKRKTIHRIMSRLSEDKRQQLYSCLQDLRDAVFEELGSDLKPPWP